MDEGSSASEVPQPRAGSGGFYSRRDRPVTGGSIENVPGEPERTTTASNHSDAAPVARLAAPVAGAQPVDASWSRIRRQYLIFRNGEYRMLARPQSVAFVDLGMRLATEHEDPQVLRDMLTVAQHKGWMQLNLDGSETFRRLAWLEAASRGIEAFGYAPTREDLERLADWLGDRAEPARSSRPGVQTLIEVFHSQAGSRGRNLSELDRRGNAVKSRAAETSGAAGPPEPIGRPAVERAADARPGIPGQHRSAGTSARKTNEDRANVVSLIADEVLRSRGIGEATRAHVTAAIRRRLERLGRDGSAVAVRKYDPGVSRVQDQGDGHPRSTPERTRTR